MHGLVASTAGGFAIGAAAWVYDALALGMRNATLGVVAQATAAGLVGSLVDSVRLHPGQGTNQQSRYSYFFA